MERPPKTSGNAFNWISSCGTPTTMSFPRAARRDTSGPIASPLGAVARIWPRAYAALPLRHPRRPYRRRRHQLKIAALWCPRFRMVHCERTAHLALLRNERFGPGCDEAVAESHVASVIWPSRIVGNIRNDHRCLVNAAAPQEALSRPIRQSVMAALNVAGT